MRTRRNFRYLCLVDAAAPSARRARGRVERRTRGAFRGVIMERPTRIMLATRVGDASAAPGRTAAWLASRIGAELTLLYVAPELRTVSEVALAAGIPAEQVRERMVLEAEDRARTWGREALEGLPFEVVVEEGDVAERVATVASELGAELVVAGAEARGALQGLILGDTTRDILRRTRCPVVVVPPLVEGSG